MKEYEPAAQRIVEKVLGVPVVRNDYNSGNSVPDLKICYDCGRSGFIEVTSDTSRPWRKMYEELRSCNFEMTVEGLRYDWFVWPTVKASIKNLRKLLPGLLQELEQENETFDRQRPSSELLRRRVVKSPFYPRLKDLGIDEIVAGPAASSGVAHVYIITPGTGGSAEIDLDRVVSWCEEFAAEDSERRLGDRGKLAATEATERHLFVIVTISSEWAVYHEGYSAGRIEVQSNYRRNGLSKRR